jgi:broad specificity phosphatase PhoE
MSSVDTAPESAATRWWWVRHAPETVNRGRIYGRSDPPCETDDRQSFRALADLLPRDAAWAVSDLQRTHQTAAAIVAAGLAGPRAFPGEGVETVSDFAEQDFGVWQGRTYASLAERSPEEYHQFWIAPARTRPPGGESFADLIDRVRPAIARLTETHRHRDIIAVAHGGTIRAALAVAANLDPEAALSFTIGNLSVTRLDHFRVEAKDFWRIDYVNRPPR